MNNFIDINGVIQSNSISGQVITKNNLTGQVSNGLQVNGNIKETLLRGLSAYEIAMKNGLISNNVTELEWLQSLNAPFVQLRINNSIIQYKYNNEDAWTDLINVKESITYNDLNDKPSINGEPISGNITIDYISPDCALTNFELEELLK